MKPTVNKRCYIRYEIKLVATLVVNNTHFIQCMIRDFCSGGLFLQPLKQNVINTLKPQQKKRILFSIKLDHGVEDFILDAKLMHLRKDGVGVAFENNSDLVFEALKKEAINVLGLISTDKRNNPANLSKQQVLENDLTSLLNGVQPFLIRNFFQRIKENNADVSAQFKKLQIETTLEGIITNLEANKNALFEDFSTNIKNSCHLSIPSQGLTDENNSESSLSLIDKTDFEDWLNLLAVIRSLESIFDLQLGQQKKKMAYIVGISKKEIVNPASPAKLCDCFRDTLATIIEDSKVRGLLYEIFEQTLLEFLPDLYEKIDTLLLDHGVPLNNVDFDSWVKINPGSGQTYDYDQGNETSDRVLSSQSASRLSNDNTNGDFEDVVSAQENKSVNKISRAVSEYSAAEIHSAFVHIHQKNINGRPIHYKPQTLKVELLQTLKSFSAQKKQLSISDGNNLEVYECLYDILLNEMFLSSDIQLFLERIYIPIMDQAMQDPDFLDTHCHPARNIVNHLFWLELAVKENKIYKNSYIRDSFETLIEKITNESMGHATTFVEVEIQLNEISKSINKSIENNINRVIEFYEGRQKLEHARQSVQDEFKQRGLVDKEIPKIIGTLLEAGWHHLLVIAKLDEDNNAFQNYLRIINNLNGWLMGTESASKVQIESILDFIDTKLQSVCTNALLHKEIISELNTLLVIRPNSYAMQMITIEKYQFIQAVKNIRSRITEVDLLDIGDWLSVLSDQHFELVKLVWINETQNVFVFVDRGGRKKMELDRDVLSKLIKEGDARKIESLDMPIMDRATNMMLQKMHKKLVYNATHDPVTHLLNRDRFIMHLKQDLAKLDKLPYLLCNIEIDNFKLIVDACGISGGDALLKQLADSLKNHLREEECIARIKEKTFSILLKNCASKTAENVAFKIQTALLSNTFSWMDKSYSIAVSMGIIPLFTDAGYDIKRLLQEVDLLTLTAHKAGRNCIRIYKGEEDALKSQLNLSPSSDSFVQNIVDKGLALRCQKIAPIKAKMKAQSQYEILLGIKDEHGNISAPDEFFLAGECTKRLLEIDRWVVLSVIAWIEEHQLAFEKLAGFSINLSNESMNSEEFLDFLNKTLSESLLSLNKITFQINETVAIDNFLFVQQFIKQIKRYHCKFSLVDLGSGCLSHTFLNDLDVDYLKIDAVFVKDIHNNSNDLAIVKSMNKIAHTLGLETIAENVENDKIHQLLHEVGVDHALGGGIQRPMLLADLG